MAGTGWARCARAILRMAHVAAVLAAATVHAAIGIGSVIKSSTTSNIRAFPSTATSSTVLCTTSPGTTGTVINGPYSGSGFTWWYVNWPTACTGYIAQTSSISEVTLSKPSLVSPSDGATVSGTSVLLDWNSVSNAGAYNVTASRNGSIVLDQVVTGTSYTLSGLVAGATYEWDVAACYSTGASTSSNCPSSARSSNRTFAVQGSLATPALVSPANGAVVSGTSVLLDWSSASGAGAYNVTASRNGSLVLDEVVTATSYSLSGLVAGSTYAWDVASCFTTGASTSSNCPDSARSSNRTFTVQSGLAAPTLVAPAHGAIVSGTTVLLDWNGVSGAGAYNVTASRNGALVLDQVVTGTSYTLSGLVAASSYEWDVASCYLTGASTPSNCPSRSANRAFTTSSGLPAPALASPLDGATVSGTSATLVWTAVNGAGAYNVTASRNGLLLLDQVVTGTSYVYSNLMPGATYEWDVASCYANAPSTDTNCPTASRAANRSFTMAAIPSKPACAIDGPAVGVVNTAFTLRALCSDTPTSWRWTAVGGFTAMPATSTVTFTPPGTGDYVFSVAGINALGTGPESALHRVTVVAATTPPPPPPEERPNYVIAQPPSTSITTLLTGGSTVVSFAVRNIGGAAASRSTKARISLVPAGGGMALHVASGIEVPALAQGTVSPRIDQTVSAAVAPGSYYVVAHVDYDNLIGQSDRTDDSSQGPQLITVQPRSTPLPTACIREQSVATCTPADQFIEKREGDLLSLSLALTNPSGSVVEWLRDGRAIRDLSQLQLTLERKMAAADDGSVFQVRVIAPSGNVVFSNSIFVRVTSSTGDEDHDALFADRAHIAGSCVWFEPPDPSKDTVVITHGWQPADAFGEPTEPPGWVFHMANQINNVLGHSAVNICKFFWPNAFTLSAGYSRAHAIRAGEDLADSLWTRLGSSVETLPRIHFIGHSHGSAVNASAISNLAQTGRLSRFALQNTILDAPQADKLTYGAIAAAFLLPAPFDTAVAATAVGGALSESWFRDHLVHPRLIWVDNYFGSTLRGGLGSRLLGAAPDGGHEYQGGHSGAYQMYIETMADGSGELGFDHSILQPSGFGQRSEPVFWTSFHPLDERFVHALREILFVTLDIVHGTVQSVSTGVRGVITRVWRFTRGTLLFNKLKVATESVSALASTVQVPVNAQLLRLDARAANAVAGDHLQVSINGGLVLELPLSNIAGPEFRRLSVPIDGFQGTAITVDIRMASSPTGAAELEVANVGFLTPEDAPANAPRLGNISTRGRVLTGNDVMIGGFVIGGSAAKTVAIVATGPSLAPYGITNPLANPTLTLVRSSDQAIVSSNDDWQSHANASLLSGAGFAPSNPLEAAMLVDLPPGAYTAIVQGAGGGTGVSVIGVYEVDGPTIPLINISTRGRVLTGNDVMIGGFVIQGSGSQTVAIVATGPSLAPYGITSPLANPTIRLVRSSDQAVIDSNDDWQSHANASQLSAAGFAPSNTLESGIYTTLPPGAYTVVVEGVGGGSGVAVIGVYKVP
jgi:hypothetical protein